jgi:PncC family amidohydrolase
VSIKITPFRLPLLQVQRTMSSTLPPSDFPPSAIRPILEEVTSLLKSRGETISIAETAAGGLISSSILSTPGASKIYKGGLTLYTLPSRIAYAGWTQESIANYSGPTTDIVAGLAKHVRKDLGSTYTLSESGTAGPTGGETENRRPGYVALAVDCERGTFTKEVKTGLGEDRVANMVQFAVEGLKLLKEVISGEAKL